MNDKTGEKEILMNNMYAAQSFENKVLWAHVSNAVFVLPWIKRAFWLQAWLSGPRSLPSQGATPSPLQKHGKRRKVSASNTTQNTALEWT